jgi:hypothetical protein
MGRGEYGHSSIGSNGVSKTAQGYVVHSRVRFADLFHERVAELDAAIQQADLDFVTQYQRGWTEVKPGEPDYPGKAYATAFGRDQSNFVLAHWQPFVRAWSATRPALLAGKIDPGAAILLMHWAARYNDLRRDAGASWGLETRAPMNVTIRGSVGAEPEQSSKTPWWKIAIGVSAVLGVGYLVLVRPSIKTGERRLAEARKLASDVGLRSGMTEEEKDRAFDAYYKKKGYPSYLLSTAPKFTT